MLYRRFYDFHSAEYGARLGAVPARRTSATKDAAALRARAARCRQLAATFYDQRIIGELEAYACEIEREAARLEPILGRGAGGWMAESSPR